MPLFSICVEVVFIEIVISVEAKHPAAIFLYLGVSTVSMSVVIVVSTLGVHDGRIEDVDEGSTSPKGDLFMETLMLPVTVTSVEIVSDIS